jgi:hypothetical protein
MRRPSFQCAARQVALRQAASRPTALADALPPTGPPCGHAPANFDRIAPLYRWLEYLTFGRALERCRLAHLASVHPSARHALVLGDGDGRFTVRLMRACPRLRVTAVDSSAAMLALLSTRVERAGARDRLTVICQDAVDLVEEPGTRPLSPPAGSSLLVSHFFFDCLAGPELRRLLSALGPRLAPGAQWLVSEFATPTRWSGLVVGLLYRCFGLLTGLRVQTLPPWRMALQEAGFRMVAERQWLGGLLSATRWQRLPQPDHQHPPAQQPQATTPSGGSSHQDA